MLLKPIALLATLLLAAWTSPESYAPSATAAPGHVIEVRLTDKGGGQWRFEPADIQAAPGDTVRFIQVDIVPHNVEFKKTPPGAKLGAAKMGPFLLTKGATYDLVIDARFPAGPYAFSCTPHEVMGMKGTLVVGPGS